MLTENDLRDLVIRAAKQPDLRCTGPHMLRHTFCSHLAMRGAPARAIQELAGHRELTTTQRYMHLSPSAVENAIRLLDSSPNDFRRSVCESRHAAAIRRHPGDTTSGVLTPLLEYGLSDPSSRSAPEPAVPPEREDG